MIHLYNSRTRRKEAFQPLDPANIRMYVCGPTVYDRAHIGNARPVVVFDVLYRLLRHNYGADHVTYVRNFTDVDDKIIARAQETQRPGETLEAACRRLTDETIGWYHEDVDALGALRPTHEPRCTEYIPQMVEMTRALVEKGYAYEAEGHVLFAVDKWPRYGELSGRSTDDMIAGSRVEVAPYKRSPMDFVLWKPSTPEQPGWPSPWGRGRPGWHIECSAMAKALLGEVFDIHGGGIDLQFPHHENELAQSCCVHDRDAMAQVWMHNEMLQADGKKMSKSLGNFFTVRDILDGTMRIAGGKHTGPEIRAALLMSHYRDVVDFGVARRHEARLTINEFAQRLGAGGSEVLTNLVPGVPLPEIVDAVRDDLDTPKAIQLLRRRALTERYGPSGVVKRLSDIYASQLLLGLDLKLTPMAQDAARNADDLRGVVSLALETSSNLARFAERIDAARAAKNFAEADALREKLKNAGVEVQTTRDGTKLNRLPNFDPAKLEALQ